MPRRQPPLPIVTTSGQSVTQQQFGYVPSRQRPSAERPGQLGGKTVTVKAVCRSDIQGQKATAGVWVSVKRGPDTCGWRMRMGKRGWKNADNKKSKKKKKTRNADGKKNK